MNTINFGTLITYGNSNMKLKSLNGGLSDNYQGSYVNNCFVALGTNTTAPTYQDYAFNRITTLNQTNNVVNRQSWAGSQTYEGILQVITTYQNTGSSDVTVSELGIITAYNTSEWDNPAQAALVAREVLDSPVIIAPGETYAFSMTIK